MVTKYILPVPQFFYSFFRNNLNTFYLLAVVIPFKYGSLYKMSSIANENPNEYNFRAYTQTHFIDIG